MQNESRIVDAPTSINFQVSLNLRRLRAASGLSLDALAARTGVSRSMLSLQRGDSLGACRPEENLTCEVSLNHREHDVVYPREFSRN